MGTEVPPGSGCVNVGLPGPLEVVANEFSTCVLLSDHTVRCRATEPSYAGVGVSTAPVDGRWVTPEMSEKVSQLSANGEFTCALLRDGAQAGKVRCWGGYGDFRFTPATGIVQNLSHVAEVATFHHHGCARTLLDGTEAVRCWGTNVYGETGERGRDDGGYTLESRPILGLPRGVSQLVLGPKISCALIGPGGPMESQGNVYCWGFTEVLGVPNEGNGTAVRIPEIIGATAIAAFNYDLCFLNTGSVSCLLGEQFSSLPTGSPSIELRAGPNKMCVRLANDRVFCATDFETPAEPGCLLECPMGRTRCPSGCADTTNDNAHCGACGHPCADGQFCAMGVCQAATMCPAGQTLCSGQCRNLQSDELHCGACGMRCAAGQACAMGVCAATPAVTIGGGRDHACAIIQTGAVRCWGKNDLLQLGVTRSSGLTCTTTGISEATQLSASPAANHTCARLRDYTARCWGDNGAGQLGTNMSSQSSGPVAVLDGAVPLTGVRQVAVGRLFSCALLGTSPTSPTSVRCWGMVQDLRGSGPRVQGDSITVMIDDATEIVAGDSHVCALTRMGLVKCFGNNGLGQVRGMRGQMVPAATPVMVDLDAVSMRQPVQSLAAGNFSTYAVLQDGTVVRWGDSGDSPRRESVPPTRRVVAGESHTCALLRDGTAQCWGANASGQLGDGTTTSRPTPVAVMGLAGGDQIIAGGQHTCARNGAGFVFCWGDNASGQLGDGMMAPSRPRASTVTCFSACSTGTANCSGVCADTMTDLRNCGSCGNSCGAGLSCIAGACITAITCTMPSRMCGMSCVNTLTDTSNCGMCENACMAGQACRMGRCECACATGLSCCGPACFDLQSDQSNCGSCGNACTREQSCARGLCVGTGPLRITLTWDQQADLDLHVIPPACESSDIYWMTPNACGGHLDVDDIGEVCAAPISSPCTRLSLGMGPENVFWSAPPPSGSYVVCVVPFSGPGTRLTALPFRTPVTATVRVYVSGVLRTTFMRTFTVASPGSDCSATDPNFIGQFTL